MLRPVVLLFLLTPLLSLAQKPDRRVMKGLQADVSFLAGESQDAGQTPGADERKLADYLVSRYRNLQIPAYGETYIHPFSFIHGLEMNDSRIVLGGQSNLLGGDAFPLPFSANGAVSGDVLIDVQEQGAIWLLPLYADAAEAQNAAFDWQKSAWKQAAQAVKDGATAVIFYDSYGAAREHRFDPMSTLERLRIPVAFVGHSQWKALSEAGATMVSVELDVRISKPERTASNVLAWIDNKAAKTIVIGANYDSGESLPLTPGGRRAPHIGADDNASGTAALLQLAELMKKTRLRNYNLLFAHFSGLPQGQAGAAAFCRTISRSQPDIAAMIDVYMLGQLSDSSQELMHDASANFPDRALIPAVMKKARFQERRFKKRCGGSESDVFQKHGVPVLALCVSDCRQDGNPDDVSRLNYAGEARIVAAVQTLLKQLDAAAAARK